MRFKGGLATSANKSGAHRTMKMISCSICVCENNATASLLGTSIVPNQSVSTPGDPRAKLRSTKAPRVRTNGINCTKRADITSSPFEQHKHVHVHLLNWLINLASDLHCSKYRGSLSGAPFGAWFRQSCLFLYTIEDNFSGLYTNEFSSNIRLQQCVIALSRKH